MIHRQQITYKLLTHKLFLCISLLFSIFSCKEQPKPAKVIERSMYYWKSQLKLSNFEKGRIDSLGINTIYLKFFDVGWNEVTNQPMPIAKLTIDQTINEAIFPYTIIPTIFITNECIQKIDSSQIEQLAKNTIKLTKELIQQYPFKKIREIQFDCDWTALTKEKYFSFLHYCKKDSVFSHLPISATIRLHQIKYVNKTGFPPVNKGLLMCYNMGNLKNPNTQNSIIETTELDKYIPTLYNYPLPLDVALPLFDWYVLFRNNVYVGLINQIDINNNVFEKISPTRYRVISDTIIQSISLQKNDIIRAEKSEYSEIIKATKSLQNKIKNTQLRVSLFHLDSIILSKYSINELESIYNSMR